MEPSDVHFFADRDAWRRWLEQNHQSARVLWVGFCKKGSGRPSITWPEAVDGALCFGWIDGIRKRIDDDSYTIRFTPRKPRSIWSAVNLARVEQLSQAGFMHDAGLAAFDRRTDDRSRVYSYEQRIGAALDPAHEARLRDNAAAWAFFQSQPASYRRAVIWWVVSAKQEATRLRRLATLIEDSANGRTVPPFTRTK